MDLPGLRRRSPNPNSPATSSLSSHSDAQSHYSDISGTKRVEGGRFSNGSLGPRTYPTPTIRLVRPSFSNLQATPQIRARSEDGKPQDDPCPPSVDLRRSETTPNPRSHTSKYTWRPYSNEMGNAIYRPVPPLPLNIRKLRMAEPEGSLKPAKSVGSSIFSLRNPFKWHRKEEGSQVGDKADEAGSQAMSLRASSMRSKWSQDSSGSATSTRQLLPPGKPLQGSGMKTRAQHPSTDGAIFLPRSMTMRRSRTGCMTQLGKFPRSSFGHVERGWTVYKWILLVSVISVSDPFIRGSDH